MKRLAGALAGLALSGLATGAMAAGGGKGGSGSTPPSGSYGSQGEQAMGQHSLEGRVLKASSDEVTIYSRGAAITFNVEKDTRFTGVKSAKDLKEGDEVRASYQLKNDTNQLKSLSKVSGTSGSSSGSSSGSPSGSESSGNQ